MNKVLQNICSKNQHHFKTTLLFNVSSTLNCIGLICLAHPACLPGGLYILPMFFLYFFVVDLEATSSQKLLDKSLPTFQGLVVDL